MPHDEEDPIMGKQSTPAPIPKPVFNRPNEPASQARQVNTTPLLVLSDAHGGITDTGERGPLWSSDCRPAATLKGLCGELLQAG